MKHLKVTLLAFIAIMSAPLVGAERPPQPPKMQSEEDTITLVLERGPQISKGKKLPTYSSVLESQDQYKYIVPRDVVNKSEILKNLIEEFPENKEFHIGQDVTPKAMEYIKQIMWSLHTHKDLKRKALVDQLEKDVLIKPEDLFDLLYAANYLNFHSATTFVARAIAKNPSLVARAERGGILGLFQKERVIPADFLEEISWYHYLIHGRNLQGVRLSYLGFDIQDYLDYRPQIFTEKRRGNRLDLSELYLISLNGFQNIPNIDTVQQVNLSHNFLSTLPENIFSGLTNLQSLSFYNNRLESLPASVFFGLTHLTDLNFRYNNLQRLPETLFAGLINLKWLSLGFNRLNALPTTVFDGLTELATLGIDNNQLSELPENIFNELTHLDSLWLNNNKLSRLAPGAFQGLEVLQYLYLDNNRLTTLVPGTFEGLANVFELSLFGNQLHALPVGSFNGLTRLVILRVGYNRLTWLEPETFQNLFNLRFVLLAGNAMPEVNIQQIKNTFPLLHIF